MITNYFLLFLFLFLGTPLWAEEVGSMKNLALLLDSLIGFFLMILPVLGLIGFLGVWWARAKITELLSQNKYFGDRLNHIESYMTSIAETQAEIVQFTQSLAEFQEKMKQNLSEQNQELSNLTTELSHLDLKNKSIDGVLNSIQKTTHEIQKFSVDLGESQQFILQEQNKLKSEYETLEQHTQEVANTTSVLKTGYETLEQHTQKITQTASQLAHEQNKLRSGYQTLEQHTQEVAKTAFEIQLNQRKMKEAQEKMVRHQRQTILRRYLVYAGIGAFILLILWLYQNVLYFLLFGLVLIVAVILYLKFFWLPNQQSKPNPNLLAKMLLFIFPSKQKTGPASILAKAQLLTQMVSASSAKTIPASSRGSAQGKSSDDSSAQAGTVDLAKRGSFKYKIMLGVGGLLIVVIAYYWIRS
ncbi:MAG: hypothetical protein AABZ60_11765 [Planctomycetota bacterium]